MTASASLLQCLFLPPIQAAEAAAKTRLVCVSVVFALRSQAGNLTRPISSMQK
jgi:hypothetical protein